MQWFKDRKTVTKLMLSFGFMAVLIGLMGYLGLRGMAAIQASLRELHQNHALGLMHLKDADLDRANIARALRQTIIDPARVEQQVSEVRKAREQFHEDFEGYRKSLLLEAAKLKAEEVDKTFKEMVVEQDKILALVSTQKVDEAKVAIQQYRALADKSDEEFRAVSDLKVGMMKEDAAKAEANFHSSQVSTIGIVLISMAIAVGLGFLIARIITQPLGKMVSVAGKLAEGNFEQKIDYHSADESGQLAQAFRLLIDALRAPVQESSAVLGKVASGDLTARMVGECKGEFISIKTSLNAAVEKLGAAMAEVRMSAAQVSSTAQELSSASEEIASGAQEQASSLEETAASLEEMTSTVKQNAENARQASQLAAGSREAAEKGGQVVTAAVAAMGEINAS